MNILDSGRRRMMIPIRFPDDAGTMAGMLAGSIFYDDESCRWIPVLEGLKSDGFAHATDAILELFRAARRQFYSNAHSAGADITYGNAS